MQNERGEVQRQLSTGKKFNKGSEVLAKENCCGLKNQIRVIIIVHSGERNLLHLFCCGRIMPKKDEIGTVVHRIGDRRWLMIIQFAII